MQGLIFDVYITLIALLGPLLIIVMFGGWTLGFVCLVVAILKKLIPRSRSTERSE